MRRQLPLIDNLYVVGIILVVAGHAGLDASFSTTPLFRWIYAFHMPLFFALAGYLFSYTKAQNRPFGAFTRQKARRLLLPLLVLTLLAFLPKTMLSAYAMRPLEMSLESFVRAFLYPAENPIRPLWFLTVLFEVYLLGYALLKLIGERTGAIITATLLLMAGFYLLPKIWFLQLSDMLYYTAFFLVGSLFCSHEKGIIHTLRLGSTTTTLLLFSTTLLPLWWPHSLLRSPYALCGILLCTSLCLALTRRHIAIIPALRPYTFTIYLLHIAPQAAIRGFVWPLMDGHGWWMAYATMVLAGLLLPWLAGRWAERALSTTSTSQRILRTIIGL